MTERRLLVVQVATLAKGLLHLRLALLVVTVVLLGRGLLEARWVSVSILAAAFASVVPLWHWHRLSSALLRRPLWLAFDIGIALWLVGSTQGGGQFLHFTLTTNALAGLLYGWWGGAICCALLIASYLLAFPWGGADAAAVQTLFSMAALYPLVAAAAAGVRALVDRQTAMEALLAEAHQRVAAGRERARLARELHDSLAKTLLGVSLSAQAVELLARVDPERTRAAARAVTRAAQTAAKEARALIGDLRDDRLDRPLHITVHDHVQGWSRRTGVAAHVEAEPVGAWSPGVRYELFAILKEALHNIERHARAVSVVVRLDVVDDELVLSVRDDGVGFDRPTDLGGLADAGHYGLIGMEERARRLAGRLAVSSRPGHGVEVEVRVPDVAGGDTPVLGAPERRRGPDREVA